MPVDGSHGQTRIRARADLGLVGLQPGTRVRSGCFLRS